MATHPLLEGRQVSKYFGGLAAVSRVDFAVYPGEIAGLVGPNGSGKTTLFDCLSRVQSIDKGQIFLKGQDITKAKPHQVAHLGLARTFQVIRVYRKMTVLENMLISRQWRNENIFSMLKPSGKETEERARYLIQFLLLDHLIAEQAGNLSGGQRRLLEIGMALMPDPDILLLDEATSGVNPTLIETIIDRIRTLNKEEGKTFLLVEHNINFISDLCSRVFVLNYGEKLAEGTPEEIKANDAVIEAYFGSDGGDVADEDSRPLLEVQDIYAGYHTDTDILKGVNLHVNSGEIVCVIGPNGAGKSTVFKALYGFLKIRSGRVMFDTQDITVIRPQDALKAGITIVPQLRSLFPQMSVFENLEMGMYLEQDQTRVKDRIQYVMDLFPRLAERAQQMAGTMSGGEQRMLEIGRALMWDPKLVLMDEPSAGLAPVITKAIFRAINRLNREIDLTVLMIEQNARQGLAISHRGYVLELGQNSYEGTGQELLDNVQVRRAFLGGIDHR